MLLDGRVALVTGASRGIGAAIASAFAREGASLVLCARGEGVETVAQALSTPERPARAMRGDVSDPAFARDLVASVRKEHGRLDVLVNNAGILRQGLIGMTSVDHMRELLSVNVFALLLLTQYAARAMERSSSASIVNLTSIAGVQGAEGLSAYAASKAAVVGFTLSCAKELAPKGIRVNAISPGLIDTEMMRDVTDAWPQRRLPHIRMGRVGTPDDVAGVAVFLASDLARYVTGQVIGVDGGMTP